METQVQSTQVRVVWWPPDEADAGIVASLEVERDEDDTNQIAVHTSVQDQGSQSSYYLDREGARRLALRLLLAAEV